MNQIIELPDHVINQIAAGEVIEKPASVVKELVENAVDAKSSHIVVSIKAGGMQQISVEDDGSGMSEKDLLLSLKRHATSKIRQIEDLSALYTMGFRGEALASIASISKMKVVSSQGTQGHYVDIHGGKIERASICSRTQGTTIDVKSIFYNVPARKKFQKSIASSTAAITKMMMELALSHIEVGFQLYSDGEQLFYAACNEMETFEKILYDRIKTLLGEDFATHLEYVDYREEGLRIQGYIGKPSYAKQNRRLQYFFVNRRAVYSPMLSKALKNSYGTMLGERDHPVCVLHLEVDPSCIDVNVHPQKREIRFKDELMLTEAVNRLHTKPQFSKASTPQMHQKSFEMSFPKLSFEDPSDEESNLFEIPMEMKEKFDIMRIFESYALIEKVSTKDFKKEYFLLDIHRLIFQILSEEKSKFCDLYSVQKLAFPIIKELPRDIELEKFLIKLSSYGFDACQLSDFQISVDGYPTWILENQIDKTLNLLIENNDAKKIDNSLSICSAYIAKNAGYHQLELLLDQVEFEKLFGNDPMGRPFLLHLTEKNLKKLF
ncbi:MAG TPA: DNA mismatch repair endonuclease MutL [Chlamydiales bacterium]|nr:DNA mismatch repair endonuclease MutL [Chlamydiales bacterium]